MKAVSENQAEKGLRESRAEGQRDGCEKRKKVTLSD